MEIAAWWAFLVLVWLATLNTYSVAEVITAVVLAVPCAIAARAGRTAAGLRLRVRPGWSRWLLALPAAVAHDTVAVLWLALRRHSREPDDTFRTVPLPAEPDAPHRVARAAVSTAILSATPGSVVVDADDDELLVHAVPIGRTRLERELRR